MRYLSSLNRRKILSENAFVFLIALLVILSFHHIFSVKNAYLDEGRYEVADGTEYRFLYKNEYLTAEKVNEILSKYGEVNLPEEIKKVDIRDLKIVQMISQVYGWEFNEIKVISDEQFYKDRQKVMNELGEVEVSDNYISQSEMSNTDSVIASPVEVGYAEGWKMINSGMQKCVWIDLIIIFIILIPVFNEDKTLGVDNLVRSTRTGRLKLDKIRIINAFQLAGLIYLMTMTIFLVPVFFMYGFKGTDLLIQSDPQYFLSSISVSFFEQFIINLAIGYISVAVMTGIALLISMIITDVYTGYAVLLFIAAASYLAELFDLASLEYYLLNFLPMKIVDFSMYYVGSQTYFGISLIVFIPCIAIAIIIGENLILLTLIRNNVNYYNSA